MFDGKLGNKKRLKTSRRKLGDKIRGILQK
jgi:hypothetical protein